MPWLSALTGASSVFAVAAYDPDADDNDDGDGHGADDPDQSRPIFPHTSSPLNRVQLTQRLSGRNC